ncbi:YheC/YheD family protein [Amphibacillus indicireducens]|uniref:ATP-grasp domain-containing protein n=1 Tax=Amphibacillus indicireducens TaxID=1076330 RepID=A0ABP7VQN2_9BACI
MAEYFENNKWVKEKRDFPTVINNIASTQRIRQSLTERKLRRSHLVTSFALGNKMYLPKILLENRKYAELLVPFKIITNHDVIINYLKENKIGVLKPILGRQGQNIYFIERIKDKYKVSDHTTIHMLSHLELIDWLESGTILKNNSYIIQRYVDARTRDSEPFDIRAHMQKDYEGKWVITRIYPRIGHQRSILSNISRGGRTQPLEEFLAKEFPDKKQEYHDQLLTLSMGLTKHLDKLYNFALSEIGLDIAIDRDGRFWLHEANNGPQSTYHEKERAVHTIGYAKYIAEKGIVLTNQYDQLKFAKNQFNSKTSKLTFHDQADRINIGMLIPEKEVNQLTVACAYVAKHEEANFFYFAPSDIDFNAMLIRGYFYEDNEWVAKIVEYPDVIYDRLRARGINQYNMIYEEFEDIYITNEFRGNSISKLEVYDKLATVDELQPYLIPYRKVVRVKDISHFIDQYTSIIVKPEVGSYAKGVHFVEKKGFDQYFVVEGANEKMMSQFEMLNYFRALIKKGALIVQKYIKTRTRDGNPFDIRAHMMKGRQQSWEFAKIYPNIGVHYSTISRLPEGGYRGDLGGFILYNYGEDQRKILGDKIQETAILITEKFEALYSEYRISDLGIDFALDEKKNLYLIEINVKGIEVFLHEFEVAQLAIPYCISLAKQTKS